MRAITDPNNQESGTARTITVHALEANKRPIGFAPWPEKPKPKPRKKKEQSA